MIESMVPHGSTSLVGVFCAHLFEALLFEGCIEHSFHLLMNPETEGSFRGRIWVGGGLRSGVSVRRVDGQTRRVIGYKIAGIEGKGA
jgi:hypothetical protein